MTNRNRKQAKLSLFPLRSERAAEIRGARSFIFYAWATGFLLSITTFAEPEDNRHVRVAEVIGAKAQIKLKKGEVRPVKVGEDLVEGDSIETGERSLVRLSFFDGSLVLVGQNSTLKLSDLRGDPKTIVHWTLALDRGAVRASVTERETQKPKEQRGIKMTIQSPVAAMGVRGTKFVYAHESDAKAGKGRSLLYTEKGEVVFSSSKDFPADASVEVPAGYWGSLEAAIRKPEPPRKFGDGGKLEDALEKYQFQLGERNPQSTATTIESAEAALPMSASPRDCIARKLGWRQAPGSNAPLGECY